MRLLTILSICLFQVIRFTFANDQNWTKPNSQDPPFTDTYIVGERIFVQWADLNNSVDDLWLTRYDTAIDTFAVRIDLDRNISTSGLSDWTIVVSETEIAKDTRFILQFLPTGQAYDPKAEPQLPSPAFNLIAVDQTSPPNGTAGATGVASPTPTSIGNFQGSETASPPGTSQAFNTPLPSANSTPSLSGAAKAGIAITAVVVGIAATVLALYLIGAHKRKAKRHDSVEEKAEGPYEVLGNSKQPVELTSKEIVVHELNSSKETVVYESDSSTIHEIATITKRPGIHELPG